MTVGELERYMAQAGIGVAGASYRIATAEGLDMTLGELGERMSAPELSHWFLLLDVENEADRLDHENVRRREEG